LCIVLFAVFCLAGLDLTDEGFYLNWIKNPWEYSFFLSAFGFFFHPLALLFPDNLVIWRWCGGLVLLISSVAFYFSLYRYADRQFSRGESVPRPAVMFLSASSFSFYSFWLPTPNYNLLNLAGCLFFLSGLLCVVTPLRGSDRLKWFHARMAIGLLAIGSVEIWMARPTTLISMSLIAALLLILQRQRHFFWQCGVATVASLLLSFIVVIAMDGSVGAFVERYKAGLLVISLLRPPFFESVLEQFSNHIPLGRWFELLGLSAAFLLIVLAGSMPARISRPLTYPAVTAIIFSIAVYVGGNIAADNGPSIARLMPLAAVLALVAVGVSRQQAVAKYASIGAIAIAGLLVAWFGASVIVVVLILITAVLFLTWAFQRGEGTENTAAALQVAVLLCWAPVAFGFGSGNFMDLMAGLASTFWAAAAVLLIVIFLPKVRWLVTGWMSVAFTCATAASLLGGAANPYRLRHSLWNQRECIGLGRSTLPICLDHASAVYFQSVKTGALASGFAENEPIIDLTGFGPTTIFFLGGVAVGAPWIMHGYPKSQVFAHEALATVARERLANAWVLNVETDSQEAQQAVMKGLGLPFPSAYSIAARVPLETFFDRQTHVLLKPE